jgi:hypothetical protein
MLRRICEPVRLEAKEQTKLYNKELNDLYSSNNVRCCNFILSPGGKLPYCLRYIAKGETAKKTLSERSLTKHALLYHV